MRTSTRRGGALLAVLWLTAALSAIAFTIATTVRGELERASTNADGVKTYFLAKGALERALLYVLWGPQFRNPDGTPKYFAAGLPRLYLPFPTGEAIVEILPENSKLGVNFQQPQELIRLLLALGAEPERALQITQAIVDWRQPMAPGAASQFDSFYLSRTPSFRGRHASLEEIEEVLLMPGMTRDLFFGRYDRDAAGRLVPTPGFRDCASVYAGGQNVDANTAPAPVLAAIGIPPDAIYALLEARRVRPFLSPEQFQPFRDRLGPAGGRVQVGGSSIYTLRATARLRLPNGQFSDLRRVVAATVKFQPNTNDAPYHILRWQDAPGLGGIE